MGMTESQITRLLKDWSSGDPDALSQLLPLVMDELRSTAVQYLKGESHPPTQPTGLANEVCIRLLNWRKVSWENRAQFFAFVGRLMRRILVDHARARRTAKRGEGIKFVTLTGAEDQLSRQYDLETLIDIDRALELLEEFDPRASTIVELRFFAGMTGGEIAQGLKISRQTVTRDLKVARHWLARELGHQPPFE